MTISGEKRGSFYLKGENYPIKYFAVARAGATFTGQWPRK